jgi:transcriptional/translational regulatory protein YebC/TACO1
MFDKMGRFIVPAAGITEDRLMEIALEAGADDLEREGETFAVYTSPTAFGDVQQALEKAGLAATESGFVKEAKNMLSVDAKKAQQNLRLLEVLEDHDDVQHVFANLDFDEAQLASESD